MTLGDFAAGALKVVGYGCVGLHIMNEPDAGVTAARDAWLAGDDEHATLYLRLAEIGFEHKGQDPLAGV